MVTSEAYCPLCYWALDTDGTCRTCGERRVGRPAVPGDDPEQDDDGVPPSRRRWRYRGPP